MKKNLGITDRIIRFVLFDLLIGSNYLGIELSPTVALISFILSILLLITIIIGYSPVYHIFGISTREKPSENTEEED